MRTKKRRIGIIGCGAIGTEIALACEGRLRDRVSLVALADIDAARARALARRLVKKVSCVSIDQVVDRCDLVVEAASASISGAILRLCIAKRRDCMIMSVGGLLGHEALLAEARSKGVGVYIPSGALCGIDGLKAAMAGTVDSVVLTTRKPVRALAGAPYIREKKIDLDGITRETVIFDGTAEDAVKAFPQNVNVSAVLSLAGIGAKKTRVRLITAPGYARNIHEVEITGEFGRIQTRTENLPSRANPKTSAMAFFSAIATLDAVTHSVQIGT